MHKSIFFTSLILALWLTACGTTEGPPGAGSHSKQAEANVTAYTARIPGSSPEEMAILLTQTVYPATREDNSVGAIIVVPQDSILAYMAMHRVTHMPVNAPLLYLNSNNRLSEETLREMDRLNPDGVFQDGRVDVYTLNVPAVEVARIRNVLGYKVREFNAPDPVAMAELLDRWQAALKSDFADEVVISAVDHPNSVAHGIGAMGWNAHMGKGFAWVYRDSIPALTKKMLERRWGECFIYLVGDGNMISDEVAQQLGEYGIVRRIKGPNPYATNAVNAGYKDYGRNYGWWWHWQPRSFGWGIAQAGHNYIIGSSDRLLYTIPAAVLGHMGKHGPILLVSRDSVPPETADYLNMVKPFPTSSQATVLNFGWIIGDADQISMSTQTGIDRLLSPFPAPTDTIITRDTLPSLQEEIQ